MTCSRTGFCVSASTSGNITTATPFRIFGNRHLNCEMHGQQFRTSDEAFAAMDAHGYTEPALRRSSVPLPAFSKLRFHVRQAQFDALYRLFKHNRGKTNQIELRAKLRRMAKNIGIFHPVARVYTSPRATSMKYVGGQYVPYGMMENSLLK